MRIGIIGGGISGMVSAINLSNNNEVTILEKNNKCGKKLLMTGNGRCNYWNEFQDLKCFYSKNKELIDKIVNKETEKKVFEFLDNLGLVGNIKNGYYYPFSNQAITFYNLLLDEINKRNIKVIYNTEVKEIIKKDNFIIKTNNNDYYFDKVILATGGKTYKITGSDGFGYELLNKLGHNIITPLPSLTGLKIKDKYNWHGIRTEVNLKLIENDKEIYTESGEIQLTNYGISGICVFNLSGLVSLGLNENKKEEILINFIPFLKNKEEAKTWFINQTNKTNKNVIDIVNGILNDKLVHILINEKRKFNELNNYEQDKIINNLINFKVEIKETNSFDEAQVTIGGVSLEDIDLNTMESRIIPGLFIIGELLDITGICGGYNIGLALRTSLMVNL